MRRWGWALLALSVSGCASLASSGPAATVSSSSALPWAPPPGAAPPAASPKPPEIPEDLRARATNLTLTDVVDVALRNSPQTREAWWRARAAAAEIDIRRASLLPEIDAQLEWLRARQALSGGQTTFSQTTLGPGLTLN